MPISRVPSPKDHLGFDVGEDRKLADWPEIVEYFRKIANTSDRVTVEDLGKTTEGNSFIVATVTSPQNHDNLEKLRKAQLRLLDPEGLKPEEAEKLISEGRTIAIISCSIHSTEVGGSQMSMELLHRLSTGTDAEVEEILDNVILLIVPSLNPDGNRMVYDWYQKHLGTPYEGTSPPWLYHKYAGHDNNRDWFMFTLPETRMTVEKIHNRWHPQIVYDIHQMGKKGPRFYVPPYIDPIDPNVDPVIASGCSYMGLAMADALAVANKKGITVAWEFDAWTPARAYQHYHGGIRILSEAASCDIATPIEVKESELEGERGFKPRDARWSHVAPWKGGKWSLRDIVDYEFIASMALLRNAAKNRDRWVRGSYEIGKRSLAPNIPYGFIIPKDQHDPRAFYELLEILRIGDIRLYEAKKAFTAAGIEYPEGSIVVPIAQPYGRFAKTMLEKQVYPDLRKNPTDPPEIPYDVTAQSLGLIMGVEVVQIQDTLDVETQPYLNELPKGAIRNSGKPYYAFSSSLLASTKVANTLLNKGFTVYRSSDWVDIEREELKPGSFIVEESKGLNKTLEEGILFGVDFHGLDNIPEIAFQVTKPRVGVYKGWGGNADEGWLRMVLEEYGFEYTSLTPQEIREGNLSKHIDVLVFPDQSRDSIMDGMKAQRGSEPNKYEPKYRIGVGEEGTRSVQEFIGDGGCVIAFNKASMYTIKDLLAPAENPLEGLKDQEFYIPGSILKVNLDETHPIAYGYGRDASIFFMSGPAFKLKEGYAVAKYPEANPLQSGWILGEKQLHGLAAVADIPSGRGNIILFGFSPHFRNQTRGTFRMLFNAIYYGAAF
jgi:hypothetical protein